MVKFFLYIFIFYILYKLVSKIKINNSKNKDNIIDAEYEEIE